MGVEADHFHKQGVAKTKVGTWGETGVFRVRSVARAARSARLQSSAVGRSLEPCAKGLALDSMLALPTSKEQLSGVKAIDLLSVTC